MRFAHTLFCWEKNPTKLIAKCYGMKNGNPVPENFEVGDTTKLYVHTEELGYVIHTLTLSEETFAGETVILPDGVGVGTDDLWAVYREEN